MLLRFWKCGRSAKPLITLSIILLSISCTFVGTNAQNDSYSQEIPQTSYQSKGGSKGGSSSSGTTTTGGKTGTGNSTTTTGYYSSGGGSVFLICILICCVGCIYCCTCGRGFNNQQGQQDPHYHPAPQGDHHGVEMKDMHDCCDGNQVVKHGPPSQLNGYDHNTGQYGNPAYQQPGQYPGAYPGPYNNPYPGPYPGNQYNTAPAPNTYQITVSPPQAAYPAQGYYGQPDYVNPGAPAHGVVNQLPPGFAEMTASNPVPHQYSPQGFAVQGDQGLTNSGNKDLGSTKDSSKLPQNPKTSEINTSMNWSKALESVKGSKSPQPADSQIKPEQSKQPFTPNNTAVPEGLAESTVISSKLTANDNKKGNGFKPTSAESTIRNVDPQTFAKS
jgi:hypothetical protein